MAAWRKYASVNKAIIGPNDHLSPDRRQAIVWTDDGILSIGPLGTNFSKFVIEIHALAFTKMYLKMSSWKWRPSYIGLNMFNLIYTSNPDWTPLWTELQRNCKSHVPVGINMATCRWFSARLQYLQCVSNGDTAVFVNYLTYHLKINGIYVIYVNMYSTIWYINILPNAWKSIHASMNFSRELQDLQQFLHYQISIQNNNAVGMDFAEI